MIGTLSQSVSRILWVLLLAGFAVAAAEANVIAKVDRSVLAADETLTLTLRIGDSTDAAEPNLSVLENDFEILGSSRSSNITINNGRWESFVEWTISLAPRHAGKLHIPALSIGSANSSPMTITVTEPRQLPGTARGDVFVEIETDRDKVYVQAQLLLSVRVYHAVNFDRGASLSEPEFPNTVVKQLEDRSYAREINGRRYGVFERRYALYPQRSGELVVPVLNFRANLSSGRRSWFDSLRSGRELRARSMEKRIPVLPQVSGSGGDNWLPASTLSVAETWDRPPEELRVGDSATRTVTIEAHALLGSQLPPLPELQVDGLKLYPDQADVSESETAAGFHARRIDTSAVVPVRAGEYLLPEIRVSWWDTGAERHREALVPARQIRVLPAPGGISDPTDAPIIPLEIASDTKAVAGRTSALAEQDLWFAISTVLALGWLFSSWQWWRLRRRLAMPERAERPTADAATEKTLYRQLQEACGHNDGQRAESLLSAWLAAYWQEPAGATVSRPLSRFQDPQLNQAAEALLANRYGPDAGQSWQGLALAEALQRVRQAHSRTKSKSKSDPLPPLYPEPS